MEVERARKRSAYSKFCPGNSTVDEVAVGNLNVRAEIWSFCEDGCVHRRHPCALHEATGCGVGSHLHCHGDLRPEPIRLQAFLACQSLCDLIEDPRSEERRAGKECRSRWSP